ncbi:cardiolipin synthetase 2 [Tibeticola sediminis]|uniref:Cardiolipin synthase n=1 Tax=Tibeticola sediminis TaxID=1917811 RepID=A0A3N4U3L2_9BURK|nr:cardiolipin synthase [Tibeticola sediminis]RPE65032.1 cardiolipin synthetase 2 [Tibeticola sediminis]
MPVLGNDAWTLGALVASAIVAPFFMGHALLHKREPRSATLWLLVIAALPLAGSVLYLLFGVNRIERRARRLRASVHRAAAAAPAQAGGDAPPPVPPTFQGLAHLVESATGLPLTAGNAVEPLHGGAMAYPEMLRAIDEARHSIALASYIFDGQGIGSAFVDALVRAHRRGVAVRVLIDDVNVRLSRQTAYRALARERVPVASFNPPIVPARLHAVQLRNHRKLLLVDGRVGFTGGMNIHAPYWSPAAPQAAFRDLHFRIEGPVLEHLMLTFTRDWFDSADEWLGSSFWRSGSGCPAAWPAGDRDRRSSALARGIEAGPDDTIDRLLWTWSGALASAQHSVRIRTPYFVPETTLLTALSTAALRGVEVDLIVPQRCDHAFVGWASRASYAQVLEHGVRVFERPGPFDHTKLMLVDRQWVSLGSANWDARSLRLNFEFNLEVYDAALAARLEGDFFERRAESHPVTLAHWHARPLAARLRDHAARLFTPIL